MALVRATTDGTPCISADVPLGALAPAAVVGSFTVDGLTFAVRPTLVAQLLVEGPSPVATQGGDELGAEGAEGPSDGAHAAGEGLQVQLVGVDPTALAAQRAKGLPPFDAGRLALPESVSYQGSSYALVAVGAHALAGCGAGEVVLPATVDEVHPEAFRGSAVQRIAVAEGNAALSSYDGALYSAGMTRILLVPEGRSGQLRISSLTEEAAPEAFSHCASVEAFSVDAGCPGFSSEDGSLYDVTGEVLVKAPIRVSAAEPGSEGAQAPGTAQGSGELATGAEGADDSDAGGASRAPEGDGSDALVDAVAADLPLAGLAKAATANADPWTLTVNCGEGPVHYYKDGWATLVGVYTGSFTVGNVIEVKKNTGAWLTVRTTDESSRDITVRGEAQPSGWRVTGVDLSADLATATFTWTPYLEVSTEEGSLDVRDADWNLISSGNKGFSSSNIVDVKIGVAPEGFRWINMHSSTDGKLNVFGVRPGYSCIGWNELTLRSFSPKWSPITYQVTYELSGGSISGEKAKYDIESLDFNLPVPTRAGYTFTGWSVVGAAGAGVATSGTTTTVKHGTYGNLTATARWGAPYSATFNAGGGTMNLYSDFDTNQSHLLERGLTSKVVQWDGAQAVYGADTSRCVHWNLNGQRRALYADKAGHSFKGWSVAKPDGTTSLIDGATGGQQLVPGATYTATWEPYLKASTATAEETLTLKDGGWNNLETGKREITLPGLKRVLVETNMQPSFLNVNTAAGPRNVFASRGGYNCVNWTEVSTNHYMPVWQKVSYAIGYELRGGVVSNQPTSYDIETPDFQLPIPTRVGYDFAGWTVTGASGAGVATTGATTTVKRGTYGNLTATANWTPISYAIAYDLDGGAISGQSQPTSYTIETPDFPLPTPTRTGYTFAGWTVTGAAGAGITGPDITPTIKRGTYGNLKATARWGAPWRATFDAGGGSLSVYDGFAQDPEKLLAGGVAQWEPTWDGPAVAYGMEKDHNAHWNYLGEKHSLYAERPGHAFKGWAVTYASGSTGLIGEVEYAEEFAPGATYTAQWEPYLKASTEQGSLTLRDGGWNDLVPGLKEVKVETNLKPSFLNLRVADGARNVFAFREGYTCVNWTEKEANHYVPVWEATPYAIAYDVAGGDALDAPRASYTIEDAFDLPVPTRYGYQFDGWDVEGAHGEPVETVVGEGGGKVTRVKGGTYGNLACTALWTLRYDLDVPVAQPEDVTFEADSLTGDVRVAAGSSAAGSLLSYMAVPVALDSLACEGLGASDAPAGAAGTLELEAIFGPGSADKVSFTATFEGEQAPSATVQVGGSTSLVPQAGAGAACRDLRLGARPWPAHSADARCRCGGAPRLHRELARLGHGRASRKPGEAPCHETRRWIQRVSPKG